MAIESNKSFSLVYPVFSRRTGGLSLGIDSFPDRKYCSFDCPYCEVHPFSHPFRFSLALLERELNDYLEAYDFERGMPIGDICLAGHGEPTLSPELEGALAVMAAARKKYWPSGGEPKLVIITNATGFANPPIAKILSRFVAEEALEPWIKLDAGTQDLFERMSGTAQKLETLVADITRFAKHSPLVIQTMLCGLDGIEPSDMDLDDYSSLLRSMICSGARISRVDLYSQNRISPHGRTHQLSSSRMASAHLRIASALPGTEVRVFQ